MTRNVIRTGRMYSQDRMRARWMRGRVRRVARLAVGELRGVGAVSVAADGRDEGTVL
jgi:hypothetical protein